jgi:hypothetical protein
LTTRRQSPTASQGRRLIGSRAIWERRVKIGIATSLRKADVEAAQVYPPHPSPLRLSSAQAELLRLFSGADPHT